MWSFYFAIIIVLICGWSRDAQVVPPVVFGRERLPEIDDIAFPVEFPHGLRPGIADPAGQFSHFLLRKELHAVRPSAAYGHFLFPARRGAEERSAVAVLQHVVHSLPVSLQGKVHLADAVEQAGGRLAGAHGRDIRRRRHPQVGRQRDVAVAQHMDRLAHLRPGRLEREVLGQEGAEADAGFQRVIGLLCRRIQAVAQAGVEFQPGRQRPVVLHIGRRLVGEEMLVAESGVDRRLFGGRLLIMHGRDRGLERVPDVGRAEPHFVGGRRIVFEVGRRGQVVDERVVQQRDVAFFFRTVLELAGFLLFHQQPVAILRIVDGRVDEKAGIEHVVPAQ